jgi:tetratricopeptide (TPR) repeat protein
MALARDTGRALERDGPPGIKARAQALEDALAAGVKAFPPPPSADGTLTLLTDGGAETRAALAQNPGAVAVDNPYPRIGFYLGVYYNSIGRPDDALQALDLGFKLTSGTQNLGAHLPNLYSEKGFSLEILKRWTEGLHACQAGLSMAAAERSDRAHLYHCMGYCLNELGRFDDAEAAYRAALRVDPEDKAAAIELEYVLRHRAAALAAKPMTPP